MDFAFLLYPTARVRTDEDTSFWIMHELARRGHRVYHFLDTDLFASGGVPRARLVFSRLDAHRGFLPSKPAASAADLGALDGVFIRKEPPFDAGYLHALQILDLARERTFLINDPRGIAMAGEKLFILKFPAFIPETLVTDDRDQARRFIRGLGARVVVKPLDLKGGAGIFATSSADKNLGSVLEAATDGGRRKTMVQRFVDAARYGDKRILVLDGRILGAFERRPARHDFRANLGLGGTMRRCGVTAADRRLVDAMAPELAAAGLWFVGLDVIGGRLTEVNVTSPSGIADLKVLEGSRLERDVADFLERKAAGRGGVRPRLRARRP